MLESEDDLRRDEFVRWWPFGNKSLTGVQLTRALKKVSVTHVTIASRRDKQTNIPRCSVLNIVDNFCH